MHFQKSLQSADIKVRDATVYHTSTALDISKPYYHCISEKYDTTSARQHSWFLQNFVTRLSENLYNSAVMGSIIPQLHLGEETRRTGKGSEGKAGVKRKGHKMKEQGKSKEGNGNGQSSILALLFRISSSA